VLAGPVGTARRGRTRRRIPMRLAAKGAGITRSEPEVFLLFLALLPQFTDQRSAWPIGAQIMLPGLVHVATCTVVYTGVSVGAPRDARCPLGRGQGGHPVLRRRDDRDRGNRAVRAMIKW